MGSLFDFATIRELFLVLAVLFCKNDLKTASRNGSQSLHYSVHRFLFSIDVSVNRVALVELRAQTTSLRSSSSDDAMRCDSYSSAVRSISASL